MKRDQLSVVDPGEAGPLVVDTGVVQDAQTTQGDTEQNADAVEQMYRDLPHFVDAFVLPHYRHQLFKDVRWCAQWWEHTGAITRLELLWEAFEHMRLDEPPAMSGWLRDHFDTHMAVLTRPTGVFYLCDATEGIHRIPPLWASVPAPPTQFRRDPDTDDAVMVALTSINKENQR